MRLQHICEGCGRTEVLEPAEAYRAGWDYPPGMGAFGVLSPRTCPDCDITTTLYWRILNNDMKMPTDLSEGEIALIERVNNEPRSLLAQDWISDPDLSAEEKVARWEALDPTTTRGPEEDT